METCFSKECAGNWFPTTRENLSQGDRRGNLVGRQGSDIIAEYQFMLVLRAGSSFPRTRAGEGGAIGKVLGPDGSWLIPRANPKGKHDSSSSEGLSEQIRTYGKN